MTGYIKWVLLTGLIAATGCMGGNKKAETVRTARPDEPRESRKADADVPPELSKLGAEEITEDNFEQVFKAMRAEVARERRALERADRARASAEQEE